MSKKQSQVVILSIASYDEEIIYNQLLQAIDLLGGLSLLMEGIPKEGKILLKPNLVRKADVNRAVMTHPAVLTAVARIFQEAGFTNLYAGDSCGIGTAQKVMDGTGMIEGLEKHHVKICDFNSGTKTNINGHRAKSMMMCDQVLKADAYINVCKMKTHALERITGAVKNIYGTVYGLNKAKGHTKYSDAHSFAQMLVDLNLFVKPKLHIMDGIVAMEGNGPTSGDPIPMNVILVSTDPIALDTIFCHLIDLKPDLVPTNVAGNRHGLGNISEDQIELLSLHGPIKLQEAIEQYGNSKFNVDRKVRPTSASWIRMLKVFKIFQKKPYIKQDKCIRCGICVESCPVEGKAVSFENGKDHIPVYNYKKCIGCFCCQEMCPNKAIDVK